MGKAYSSELANFHQTVNLAVKLPLEKLPYQMAWACGDPVLLIGAGGSLSAAEFGQRLFDQKGVFGQAITPLTFIQTKIHLRRAAVFLLSASGNNKDVLAAYTAACEREAKRITIICASGTSKLARLAQGCDRAYVFAFDLPSGRDGFLATNSLVATCILLARSFGEPVVQESDTGFWLAEGMAGYSQIASQRSCDHFVLLYSDWSKLAAMDLESKLSEAGLASSMLCDYRHFAHDDNKLSVSR